MGVGLYEWSGVDLNHRHTDFQSVAQESQPHQDKPLTEMHQGTGAPHGALPVQNDPDLVLLNEMWPTLEESIKQTIIILIKSQVTSLNSPRKDNHE